MLDLLFRDPLIFVVWVLAILVALTVHEFSHALVSNWLGDPTAKRLGRLTLNPLAHVDLLGLAMLVVIGFGWGKPVPFNPYNLRAKKWGPVLVALAGPAMNLCGAIIFAGIFRLVAPLVSPANLLVQFLMLSVFLNAGLLLFNLIPLPPLDGSKVLLAVLAARRYTAAKNFLESRGPYILLGLIFADLVLNLNVFGGLFRGIMYLASWLVGV